MNTTHAQSLPQSGAPEKCFTRVGSGLTGKHQTRLERLAKDKHSSLLRKSVNCSRNKFYDTGPIIINNVKLGKGISKLSVECRYADCRYDKCRYAKCYLCRVPQYTNCHYAVCHCVVSHDQGDQIGRFSPIRLLFVGSLKKQPKMAIP